jgi:hypothetical protein
LAILLLLADSGIDRRASSKSAFREKPMQLDQGRQANAWGAQLHPRAGDRIQHPRRHRNHYARRELDVDHIANGTVLPIMPANAALIERMPAVMDLDFLPNMGRMFG